MTLRRAILRIAVVAGLAASLSAVGAVNGVGPLAHVTPPDQVADPREMLARSLQATIDASSVHVEAAVTGHVPGALVGRPEPEVDLAGTRATLDVRPGDARSHIVLDSPALAIAFEELNRWDTAAYRLSDGPWQPTTLGSVTAGTGIDANPLTLVDRLRAWLAAPGAPTPTVATVACTAPSGRCREVRLAAGATPGGLLLRLFPAARTGSFGPTTTDLVLQADAATLRPATVVLDIRSADGALDVTVSMRASAWDDPSVIEDPPGG